MTESKKPDTTETDAGKISEFISDGVLVAIITGLSYYCAYNYEAGYLSYFKIPRYLVTVSIEQIVVSISALFVFFALLMISVNFYLTSIPAHYTKKHAGPIFLIILFIILFSSITILLPWGAAMIYAMIFLISWAATYFVPPLFKNRNQSYMERLSASLESHATLEDRTVQSRMLQKFGSRAFLLLMIGFFVLPSIASLLGARDASRERTFLVADKEGPWALVRKYSDKGILVRFDPAAKTTTRLFEIVELGTAGEQRFVSWDVGPLRPTE